MKINISRKILVIGLIFLFLGASTMLGVNAFSTNGQTPQAMGQICLTNNVKISDNIGNDRHPRMATNAHDQAIVVYEKEIDIFTKTVPVMFSTDDGLTWTSAYEYNSINFTSGSGLLQYPAIVYNVPNDLLFLAMVDPNAEMYNSEVKFIPGDIANAVATGYDFTENWYGLSFTGCTSYTYGAATCTDNFFLPLTTQDGYSQTQAFGLAFYTYPDFEYPPGMNGISYDGNSLFKSAPNAEVEMGSNANRIFIVAETARGSDTIITIKSTVNDETLLTCGEQQNGMDKYADVEQWPGEYIGLGIDPDVSGSGNKVCVVYVQDGAVKCSYSACDKQTYNPGFSWQVSTVDSGASTPAVYMQGNNVICAYVKDGNLYCKLSSDGGATWGEASKKNDVDGTVVTEKGAVDVDKNGIVFTDNRDGNYDIYFQEAKGAAAPELVIELISGGVGVSAVIKNTGDAAASNFAWSIKSDGTVFVGGEKTGTATLTPDASTTIKSGLMLGFGAIAITVTADTATRTASGKLLLFFVTGL
ncbi:Uncharacterised protein [uncultured archaeon]|nr:Uncharacterised protein [uncultured archaeon]